MSRPATTASTKRARNTSKPNSMNNNTIPSQSLNVLKNIDDRNKIVLPDDIEFDLDRYIDQYTGITRVYRCLYIAQHCTQLSVHACILAITLVIQNKYNVILYNECITVANTVLTQQQLQSNQLFTYNKSYVDTITRTSTQVYNRLDIQYDHAKKDGDRDLLRSVLIELGEYYYTIGEYNSSISKYLEAREYIPQNDIHIQL